MQLICETKPTDDIKTNMSTQAGNPVNGDISDIRNELNFINKENNSIDEETIVILEKSLSTKTESDVERLSSETIKEIVQREENRIEVEIKCNLEEKETTQKIELLDNVKSHESENSFNGTSKKQDEIQLNYGNPDTTNEVRLTIKEQIDAEVHLKSNSDECINISKKDENAVCSIEPDESNEISTASTGIIIDEPKPCSEEKVVIVVSHTTNIIQTSCEKTSEASDLNTEGPENITGCAYNKIIDKETKTASSSENIYAPINNSDSENINTNDEISIDGERNKLSDIVEDVSFSNNSNKQDENNDAKCNSLIKKCDDFTMLEKVNEPSKAPVDIDMIVEDKMLDDNNLLSIDEENLDVAMNEVKTTCTGHVEKLILKDTELEIVTKNKETLETKSPELNLLHVVEDTLMSKPTLIKTSKSAVTDIKEPVNDEILENALNSFQKNVENLGSVVNTTILSDENVVGKEKEVDISVMEIDDVEILDVDKDKSDKDIKNIKDASNDFGKEKSEIDKLIALKPLSEQNANTMAECMAGLPVLKEMDSKETDKGPMEIDDVEIVELDKETQHKNISESGILPEEIETNSNTKLHNEDGNCKDVVTPTITDAAGEADNIEAKKSTKEDEDKVEIVDEDDIKIVDNALAKTLGITEEKQIPPEQMKTLPVVCKLSNTLDILSDDEEDSSKIEENKVNNRSAEKQCINLDDDDDIMLIEEDSNSKEATSKEQANVLNTKEATSLQTNNKTDDQTDERQNITSTDINTLAPTINEKDISSVEIPIMALESASQPENITEEQNEKAEINKPLLPQNFLKTAKKNLADMTRHELEDFCILRIVESIVDRSNLSDIKTKMKTMAQNLEDYKKRAMMLTKQNRDLQVVLKSVQEEQKRRVNAPIQPLKITRSVGMQVLMNDKIDSRKKSLVPNQTPTNPSVRPARIVQAVKVPNKPVPVTPPTIPVPRKVPVNNSPAKTVNTAPTNNMGNKAVSPNPNGLRNPSPVQKAPEKRTHSRMQATSSVTVDLTDDEPPPKINNKSAPVPPVRVVPPQNLLAPQRPFSQPLNSPRKVYIPISSPQTQILRPGQTLMMKNVPSSGPRQRLPAMPRMQQSPIRINKQAPQRHPAPLPDAMKQYTPPTWKALPPAPDLKLSKVENGIVISWKIDGLDSGYETIASYQLYAYQETTTPPCTALWKKIGDVKALPLPMACTLTQFMAGFKYYFAVRAVDIRSRLGPFSLPGSILLLNKM